jgi:hypothetical protein
MRTMSAGITGHSSTRLRASDSATDVIHIRKRAFALLVLNTVKQIRREVGHKTQTRGPFGSGLSWSGFSFGTPGASSLLTSTRGEWFGSRSIYLTNPFGSADGAARTVEVKVLYEKAGVRVWFHCHCSRGQTTRPQTRSRHRFRIERSRLLAPEEVARYPYPTYALRGGFHAC